MSDKKTKFIKKICRQELRCCNNIWLRTHKVCTTTVTVSYHKHTHKITSKQMFSDQVKYTSAKTTNKVTKIVETHDRQEFSCASASSSPSVAIAANGYNRQLTIKVNFCISGVFKSSIHFCICWCSKANSLLLW